MGNSNGRESRSGQNPDAGSGGRREQSRGSRLSRGDLGGFLNLQSSHRDRENDRQNAPFERRETKQEREARRLERDRVARIKERERSLREEHVDGGYLVTLGTYSGIEDFSKLAVRQLQIERRLAPFWRGLQDHSPNWAEHQLIAAARGLPIPAADAPPEPGLVPQPRATTGEPANRPGLLGERTLSAASDRSEHAGPSSDLPSPAATGAAKSSSLRPRAKAFAAALNVSSRNTSATELAPREIALPSDPFVNGQPIEVFLYKDAQECPICFLAYPPYLNRTRCCDQPICSECFVQIKRPDPHLPEHHPDGQARDPNQGLSANDPPEMLTSEPAVCPYCQQTDFGVTYEPPPFRRGLAFSNTPPALTSTAMSSQTSITSNPPPPMSPQQSGRRRTHSISASAPNVITTDRVRPDWAMKLAAARAHQARRAAAATALHTAAFLVGNNEQRSSHRPSRFGRRHTGSSNGSGTPAADQSQRGAAAGSTQAGGEGASSSRRRTRTEELEEMMFMEAVRLSLAAEEERKRKEEKAQRKEEKKRLQAERKAQKKQAKDPYGGSVSGASGSNLSLGLGRLRGNSGASSRRAETTSQGATRSQRTEDTNPALAAATAATATATATANTTTAEREAQDDNAAGAAGAAGGKGKGVDRGQRETTPSSSLGVRASITARSGSHLRQISNTSSLGSSPADSPCGSYRGQTPAGAEGDSPSRAPRADEDADQEAGGEEESLFNFRSLAELVGVNIDDGTPCAAGGAGGETHGQDVQMSAARPLSRVKEEDKEDDVQHVEKSEEMPAEDEKRRAYRASIKAVTSSDEKAGGKSDEAKARREDEIKASADESKASTEKDETSKDSRDETASSSAPRSPAAPRTESSGPQGEEHGKKGDDAARAAQNPESTKAVDDATATTDGKSVGHSSVEERSSSTAH